MQQNVEFIFPYNVNEQVKLMFRQLKQNYITNQIFFFLSARIGRLKKQHSSATIAIKGKLLNL